MSVLCDSSLLVFGTRLIRPFDPDAVQPASVDLRLGPDFMVMDTSQQAFLDPQQSDKITYQRRSLLDKEKFILHPGELVLASTVEVVSLFDWLVARVEGKSSLGRIGLLIHATAGFIDPGFTGNVTLELSNVANIPIILRPNMWIAQISFMQLDGRAARPYGSKELNSKYQDQQGPTPSQYFKNKDVE